jgi:hypothetical protein
MGKILLMKLNFKISLIELANEKTQCAKAFNIITAQAAEIPTNTLDKKINCLADSLDCPQATIFSIDRTNFLSIFKS